MPVVNRGRTMLPANARAVDVARQAVDQLVPIQQRKTAAAFRVQGIEAILYTQLTSGVVCQCKSKEQTLNVLNPDGKASVGIINRLLTGQEFDVTPYTSRPHKLDEEDGFYVEPHGGPHDDFKRTGPQLGTANDFGISESGAAGSGDVEPSLDDLAGLFDSSDIGLSEVSCPLCFGTSFVGGYTPYRTFRKVVLPTDVDAQESIDYVSSPWTLNPCAFSFECVLPRGAVGVDSFKVWNNKKQISGSPSIDGHLIQNSQHLLSFCDGRPHLVSFITEEPMTHVEIQFALSTESAFFEIPKISKSGDRSMLERSEPFQILMSPEVPQISSMDVIVESQSGKALLVGPVSPWQTRNRASLGWECQVRVVQPTELYALLPHRGKVYGQQAASPVKVSNQHPASGF